jgi:hypothetical protein
MEDVRDEVQISGQTGRCRTMTRPGKARQHHRGEEECGPADRSDTPPHPLKRQQTDRDERGQGEAEEPIFAELRASQYHRYNVSPERDAERFAAHIGRHRSEPGGARDQPQRQARPRQPPEPPAQPQRALGCDPGLPECWAEDEALEGEHSGQRYHCSEMKDARRDQKTFHRLLQVSRSRLIRCRPRR